MEDDQEIGAYMFRRTVPSMHLTPEDARCMVCPWILSLYTCVCIYTQTPGILSLSVSAYHHKSITLSLMMSNVKLNLSC